MQYDLCIIGAGPAGIEAALQAKLLGLTYILLERFDAGSYIYDTMRNKKFYHVYGRNTATLKGNISFPDKKKGYELVELWRQQVAELEFSPNTIVKSVDRDQGGLFTVHTSAETCQSRRILLTSGTFESRKRLGVEGEENNEKVLYEYDYYTEYEDEQIIVVGGGNSALETAIAHAEGEGNHVTLVVRKPELHQSVTENNRSALKEFIEEGIIEVLYAATVQKMTDDEVVVDVNGEVRTLPYDRMFIHIGFEKPLDFFPKLGIQVQNGEPVYNDSYETNVLGLYIAGALTGADSVIESSNQAYDIVHRLAPTLKG